MRGSECTFRNRCCAARRSCFAMLNRRAAWRNTKASDSQRRLVEKRLGLSKSSLRSGQGEDVAANKRSGIGDTNPTAARCQGKVEGRGCETVQLGVAAGGAGEDEDAQGDGEGGSPGVEVRRCIVYTLSP